MRHDLVRMDRIATQLQKGGGGDEGADKSVLLLHALRRLIPELGVSEPRRACVSVHTAYSLPSSEGGTASMPHAHPAPLTFGRNWKSDPLQDTGLVCN